MLLKDIFAKPVDRPIEGVIKANDEASLKLEMEEFVLTREIERQLETFLDAYLHDASANGVWISGFFGSGKSHLLKMLSLLLEDRDIEGCSAQAMFLEKCEHNAMLQGNLRQLVQIPSKSILFNIDQKSDTKNKKDTDSVLGVFVKVFNEMRGYYGKQGYIAQFERDLDSRGLFGAFQTAYENIARKSWQKGREQVLMEERHVDAAYAEVTGDTSVSRIIKAYREQYNVSIEDFADQVGQYIESQAPGFRLNFFVDEVGQYIADNVKLMTNLQTVAESLNTRCRGRAWILVTAQEDMTKVIGDMTKRQANDFSKIQARFALRLKLTSQDVDEVIQKRLLKKNSAGAEALSALYDREVNSFGTLLEFADSSVTYNNFRDREHFAYCFPFIPYQFALFQTAIRGLSDHNAFSGRYSSVGERSMLVVFQDVAVSISGQPIGRLAPFDRMYDGIRSALKTDIQQSILQAENHLDNETAKRLLKILLLVKYVVAFKATVHNLCILMLDSFEQNIAELKRNISEALGLLESQTLIQRNGDVYIYLTNEEKDIEEEIKSTDVDILKLQDELNKIAFDTILRERKIRTQGGQDYIFARKIDDHCFSREQELAINIITPFHESQGRDASSLLMQHADKCELLVVLPPDSRLMRDLVLYKQTETYVREHATYTQDSSTDRIIAYKTTQNEERKADLQDRVRELLGKAPVYVFGKELDLGSGDAQKRLIRAFEELAGQTYPHLRMLRGVKYSESDLATYLRLNAGCQLAESSSISEAEQEELNFLQGNRNKGLRTSGKSMVENFAKRPYGWPQAATVCLLAKLYAANRVEVRKNGVLLGGKELERTLKSDLAGILIEAQAAFTPGQIRRLKDFYEALFNAAAPANDTRALIQACCDQLRALVKELEGYVAQGKTYPFTRKLEESLELLKECLGRENAWYITDFVKHEDELLELKEGLIEPISAFMKSDRRETYVQALNYLKEQSANLDYVDAKSVNDVKEILASDTCYRGDAMRRLKSALESLQKAILDTIAREVAGAREEMDQEWAKIIQQEDFGKIPEKDRQELEARYQKLCEELARAQLVTAIREKVRHFREVESATFLERIANLLPKEKPVPEVKPDPEKRSTQDLENGQGKAFPEAKTPSVTDKTDKEKTRDDKKDTPEPAPIKVISINAIKPDFQKIQLVSEEDVEGYITSLRAKLIAEISQGNRIKV